MSDFSITQAEAETLVTGFLDNYFKDIKDVVEFEQDFVSYIKKVTDSDIHYFSLLRPLTEMQIAWLFSKCKSYHEVFRSCNAGSKTDSWCGHCPKCLFVYFILSPFLSREEVKEIFGTDMLEDETMQSTMEQLVGIQEEKPFE